MILDLVMPGLSGEETFQELKSLDPEVRVVISSGIVVEDEAEDMLSRGCLAFLRKPYLTEKLASVLNDAIP